jgi:hypothetical protein
MHASFRGDDGALDVLAIGTRWHKLTPTPTALT